MIKPKKIITNIIRLKKFGGKNDWDGDGVPNRKDCQPRNTMRQDIMSPLPVTDRVGDVQKKYFENPDFKADYQSDIDEYIGKRFPRKKI